MRKETLRHEVIGFNRSGHISTVNAASNAHQHVLGALGDFAMHTEEVGLFQCLEAKVVITIVARIVKSSVQLLCVRFDKLINILRDQCCDTALLVAVVVQGFAFNASQS